MEPHSAKRIITQPIFPGHPMKNLTEDESGDQQQLNIHDIIN